ncbi:MAG: ribosome maturation factor RimM [Candidatus Acidiferrum sp.]
MNDPREPTRRWVQVARVLRPRGNKGEVVAELLTDFPARFFTLKQVYLRKDNGEPQSAGLQHFWLDRNHPGMGVFHFAGRMTISEAEQLRGYDVLLPFEERVELPAGQYFVTDLIGCAVFELPVGATKLSSPPCSMEEAPRVLGTVRDVFFPGEGVAGTPLLQVETASGEMLVPLAEDICTRIDVAARRIEVTLPEGLSDVNASE